MRKIPGARKRTDVHEKAQRSVDQEYMTGSGGEAEKSRWTSD